MPVHSAFFLGGGGGGGERGPRPTYANLEPIYVKIILENIETCHFIG